MLLSPAKPSVSATRPLASRLPTPRWRANAMLLVIAITALLSACSSAGDDAAGATGADAVASATPTVTAVPTATPLPPTPVPTPSPAELYRELAPSIAYLETGDATGSGVLIEGGYVITNNHVLSLEDTVRVVFPNGTEILDAPVFARDVHSDLALVGPIDTALPEIELREMDLPAAGDIVYLLGYGDESEKYPDATMTEGIASRLRRMELHGYDFIQVDALIAPGQSGGAMFNAEGELIGISGLRFGVGNFGLVMGASTVRNEVDALLGGGRDYSRSPVGTSATITVPANRSTAMTLIADEGFVRFSAESDLDISIELMTLSGGFPLLEGRVVDWFRGEWPAGETYSDNSIAGTETIDVQVAPGQYIAVFTSFASEDTEVRVESSQELFEYVELDELQPLATNETVLGVLDNPTDSDVWLVDLTKGDRIQVRVDSISDMLAVLRFNDVAVASGDDDGYGMFGSSVNFEYLVEETGEYELIVGQFAFESGGYAVQLDILE